MRSGEPAITDPIRILLVEDREDDAELIMAAAARSGLVASFEVVGSYAGLDAALDADPTIVLTDYHLPGMDVSEVINRVRQRRPATPIIVVSGVIEEDAGVELLHRGAADLLLKDRLARLAHAVRAALETRDLALRVRLADRNERTLSALLIGLLECLPAAIAVYDHNQEQLLANARFDQLLVAGLSGDEVARLLRADVATEVEIGARVHLASAFEIVDHADHAERPARALLLTDITAQKDVEAELRQVHGTLHARSRELQRNNARLVESGRLKDELVNTVSHELRTPLTSILGYTEILMDRADARRDDDTRRLLDVIDRNDRRLLDMVSNLLQLSELDALSAAEDDGDIAQVDLNAVAAAAVEVLLPQARSAQLELAGCTTAGLPLIAGSGSQLERVLLNLGSNAIKFSRAGGRVTIRTGTDSGVVYAEVADEGVGMAEEDVARLGERFFRTDSARAAQIQGTGLGLAVVQAIVARHRGTMSVRSELGVGTTIRVTLPGHIEESP